MGSSNKPLFWGLFAAGGTLAAFLIPVFLIVTLLVGHGAAPDALGYERMSAFAGSWIGKGAIFLVISLFLWHAAHRMRTALHGLGLRADRAIAILGYGIAGIGTVLSIHYLLGI
jgi:fumarate reductase subunit D